MPEADVDGDSFDDFVAAALPGLLRFGHVLTGSPQQAEELAQDALARCWRRWRRARAGDPVAYARRVMINAYISGWRRWGARVRIVDLGELPDTAAEDAELARREDWDELRRALASLPRGQRAVLVLRYLHDLPDTSIAGLLGCSTGTVRSQAARGLATLRPLLAPRGPHRPEGDDAHAR